MIPLTLGWICSLALCFIVFFVQESIFLPGHYRHITVRDAQSERFKSVVSRYFKAVRPIHFTLTSMIQAQRYYEPLDFAALADILTPALVTNRENIHLIQLALDKGSLVQLDLEEYDETTALSDIEVQERNINITIDLSKNEILANIFDRMYSNFAHFHYLSCFLTSNPFFYRMFFDF